MKPTHYPTTPLKALLLAGAATGVVAAAPSAAVAQSDAPVTAAAPPAASAPGDTRAEIDTLKAEVELLSAEVADLKRAQSAQIRTISNIEAKQPATPTALATIADGKPTIASADGRFSATLHSIIQLDTTQYSQAGAGPLSSDLRRDGAAVGSPGVDFAHARDLKNGDLFRRARFGMDGTAFGDFSYKFLFDFGGAGVENTGQLYEAWVQYNGLKPFHVRVGAFRPSYGLEDQDAVTAGTFLERPGSTDTAAALAASDTRTAIQAFAYDDRWYASLDLTGRTIGVLNTGTASPVAQTYGDPLGLVGRVQVEPLKGADWGVHVGAHGSYLIRAANTAGPSTAGSGATPLSARTVAFNDTPELRVDGAKLINTGNIDADHADTIAAEFAAQWRSLLIQSEYEHIQVDRTDIHSNPTFNGWYVEGSWILTGETRIFNAANAAFDGPKVAHPVNFKDGGWGAWELGLRYSDMDLNYHSGVANALPSANSIRGGDQRIFSAGASWYLNSLVRLVFEYQHVKIDRLSPCTGASNCTTIWFTPVGAQIGQSYDSFSVRSQLAF